VPDAMNTLLLSGMLPLYAVLVNDVSKENPLLWFVMMVFILLAAVTVMNMLIGVLVEVVRTVAATEKEGLTVSHVTHQLREVMHQFKNPGACKTLSKKRTREMADMENRYSHGNHENSEEGNLVRADFEKFLTTVEVALIIQEIGVDVWSLIDMADMIYEEYDKEGNGLSFEGFIDLVLNMRGTNPSTLKDVRSQMRVMKSAMKENSAQLRKYLTEDMDSFRLEVMEQLLEIRRIAGSDVGSDAGGESYMLARMRTSERLSEAGSFEDEDSSREALRREIGAAARERLSEEAPSEDEDDDQASRRSSQP